MKQKGNIHLSWCVNVADIGSDSWSATDIIQTQGSNERIGFKQERERLANSSTRTEDSNLGVTGDRRREPTTVDRKTASGVSGEHFFEFQKRWKERTRDGGRVGAPPATICSFTRFPTPDLRSPMDIDKVRSYVCAQLPFVPFYGTDILGPVESLPESLGLQTPVLIARNPLAAIRPKSHTSASTCLEVQASGSTLAQADPTQTKESTEIRKKRSVKDHPLGAEERKRPLRLKRHTRTTPDPDSLSEPPTEAASTKRGKKRHRGKPRLPASLSFLYGFNPKNVGPSRLTVSHLNMPLELRR